MMNVLISVNSNYLSKAETMLYSLRYHTKDSITVYLLNHRLTSNEISSFTETLQNKCNINVVSIDVSDTALDELPIGDLNFSIEMYYRIIAQFVLPKELDRILWVDADIIALNDISDFYYLDFEEKLYVVCQDRYADKPWVTTIKEKIDLPSMHLYFNSGVLLVNLVLLRKTTNLTDIINTCNTMADRLTYPDQDILNYLYAGKVKYAEWQKYNYQLFNDKEIPKDVKDSVVLLHYTGPNKPWKWENISRTAIPYWEARFKSGHKLETIKALFAKLLDTAKNKIHFVKKKILKGS